MATENSAEELKNRLQEVVLLYNLPEKQRDLVIGILLKLNINSAQVQREIYNFPLEAILGIAPANGLTGYEGAELREPMIIMHGLSQKKVNLVLRNLRLNKVNISLKASTTPTNLKWTSLQMYLMLQRERMKVMMTSAPKKNN